MLRPVACCLALLTPTLVRAAPIEFVEQRRNFMVFDDVDGTVEHANWFTREPFYAGYYPVEEGFLKVHPDDSQFLIAYTTFSLVQGVGAFYQSLANDVKGVGYKQAAELDPVIPAEFFDDTPNSQFVGFLHMNDWHNFILPGNTGFNDEWISLVFGQELGHAWLSFVYADVGNGPSDLMLGRSNAHWNFYLETGGSPVEGHQWTDNGDGTFTAAQLDKFQFSDLDLYLMGLMAPEEVKPWFLIEDPHDCVDSALPDKECAPKDGFSFKADQYRVSGTRRDLKIEDVIAAEGPRVPAYPDAPNEFSLSFILIKRPGETLCDEELEAIDGVIERSITQWVDQTRGRADLINRTHVDDPIEPGISCSEENTTGSDATATGTGGDGSSSTAAESSSGDTPTTGQPDPTTTGDGTTAAPPETGDPGQQTDSGCGCRQSTSTPWLLGPLSMALLPLLRRRRRAR